MIGLIRVLTTANLEVLNEHGRIISELYAVPVNNECIPDQPFGIHNDETEQLANPKIVALGQRMEQDGCSVIVVSCAADPAVDLLRKHVSVPVIGAGSAASYMARMIGKPVGVMGITETLPKVMHDILGDLFVRYIQPEGVANTTDLMTPAGRQQAIQAAKTLMEQGIEVIVFACTGFSTIGLADVLRTELNIPVIDAVEAEGLIASNLYKQLKR
ncbi:aspartate/glutamate racemase family protein [Paenibacillus thalictri]|uniref:Hydantoin racemase n=1 Tax=Paenibacillus thalictri TaxID=2527873 RepID=A0A4Q9DTN3_9BACL|nr:aspartate/glutamate racemase family protein [Paenibacillus thalictri]TBL79060.1 hydantoin racemase [Paenibacillus thalictri]